MNLSDGHKPEDISSYASCPEKHKQIVGENSCFLERTQRRGVRDCYSGKDLHRSAKLEDLGARFPQGFYK